MLAAAGIEVLGEYLSDSAVSILSQTFIEIEDPITTSIRFWTSYQLPCTLSISFESVPVEHLDSLEEKLFEVFGNVVKDGIDMERMATVVEVQKNRSLLSVEKSPSNLLSLKLINEALYGSLDGKTLKEDAMDLIYYDVVSKWTSDEWVALLKRSQPLVSGLIVDGGLITRMSPSWENHLLNLQKILKRMKLHESKHKRRN